jgi:hypothetical protein
VIDSNLTVQYSDTSGVLFKCEMSSATVNGQCPLRKSWLIARLQPTFEQQNHYRGIQRLDATSVADL